MTALVVLAGGLGSRLGHVDKALLPFGGATLLEHVLGRVRGQAERIAINANGDAGRFARFGLSVIADTLPGQLGPLAGILTAMQWAAAAGEALVVTVPVDTPFLPCDLVSRLLAAGPLACARSGGRVHPVAALWPTGLAAALATDLRAGVRRVNGWSGRGGYVDFDVAEGDPFRNINTPVDLADAVACHAHPPPLDPKDSVPGPPIP